ncbi:MAG: type II secretion system F family protein [Candidatus Nezhaarchaeales archaeon]
MSKGNGLLEAISSFSYRLFKPSSNSPFISFVRERYLKAQMGIPFPAYASAVVFMSIMVCVASAIVSFIVNALVLGLPMLYVLVLVVVWAILGFSVTFTVGAYYPYVRSKNLAFRIDRALPYTVEYMAALASAGTTIETLIRRTVEIESEKAIKNTFCFILRQMAIFNVDPIKALYEAANRSPSIHLKTLLEGLSTVIGSSGDVSGYLMDYAKSLVEFRRSTLRKVLTAMGYLSEMYVALVIVGPIIIITILIIVAMLGQQLFGVDPVSVTMLTAFVLMPVLAAIVLVLMDKALSSV